MKALFPMFAILLLCGCARAHDAAPRAAATAAAATAATTPDGGTTGQAAAASSVVQRALAAHGVTIIGSMDAPAGFRGYVGSFRDQQLPIYALPDGHHVVVGSLFDLDGRDLTDAAMAKAADSRFGDAQWNALQASPWVREGSADAGRVVYVFVDTRCPFCHRLWQAYQPLLPQGHVQVRNIIVGVISKDSRPEAAHILSAKDPAAAWNANEANFGHNPPPSGEAPTDAVAKVDANTRLFQQLGFVGTPALVWKDPDGHIHTLEGMPRDQRGIQAIFGD